MMLVTWCSFLIRKLSLLLFLAALAGAAGGCHWFSGSQDYFTGNVLSIPRENDPGLYDVHRWYVSDWSSLGVFPIESGQAFEVPFFAGESELIKGKGDCDIGEAVWQPVSVNWDGLPRVELNRAFPGQTGGVYTVAKVISPRMLGQVQMQLAAETPVRVWLNGKSVFSGLPTTADGPHQLIPKLALKQGVNTIVVKSVVGEKAGFLLRFVSTQGLPYTFAPATGTEGENAGKKKAPNTSKGAHE